MPVLTSLLLVCFLAAGCTGTGSASGCPVAGEATKTAARPTGDRAASDVPTVRGNASRTGEQPGPGPAGEPRLLWSFDRPGSDPVVADGTVWVASGDALYGLDALTGVEHQTVTPGGQGPTVEDDALYFATYNGVVYAFDLTAGREKWRATVDHEVRSPPTVADGTVYVGTGGGQTRGSVYAFDAATGEERWRHEVPLHYDEFADGVSVSPAAYGGAVYVTTFWGQLLGIDAATGERCWKGADDLGGIMIYAPPVVADGIVYANGGETGEGNDVLYAVDAETGKRRWRYGNGGHGSTVAVAGGLVLTGSDDRSLYAVGARSGEQKWSFETGDFSRAAPVVAGGTVYATSGDGFLYAVDAATGTPKWRFPVGQAVTSSPAVVGGIVYVSGENALYAIAGA